eukprot:426762-Amphidinium_carterae.1
MAESSRAPAAGSAGELLDYLQSRGLRAAFPVAVSARVRSISALQSAIRDGHPVVHKMASAALLEYQPFCLRTGLITSVPNPQHGSLSLGRNRTR